MSKKIFAQATHLLRSCNSRLFRKKAGVISIHPKHVQKLNENKGSDKRTLLQKGHKRSFDNAWDSYPELFDDHEHEHIAHSITNFGSKHLRNEAERRKTEDLMRLNKFVTAKTLQNRYFKTPKTPNLLTWACKEQMRLLHAKDPDVWSCEALVETFPVSQTSVRKVLKSRVRNHRLIDIFDHDLYVKRNWERILSSLTLKSPGCVNEETEQILSNIGKEDNLLNIFSLEERKSVTLKQVSLVRKKLGPFSTIVQDELEKKEIEERRVRTKHEEQLEQLRKTMMKIKEILLDSKFEENKYTEAKKGNTPTASVTQTNEKKYQAYHDPVEISISNKERLSDSTSYRIDRCVYDENGEFLYRIP